MCSRIESREPLWIKVVAVVLAVSLLAIIWFFYEILSNNGSAEEGERTAVRSQEQEEAKQKDAAGEAAEVSLPPAIKISNMTSEERKQVEQSIASGQTVWGNFYLTEVSRDQECAIRITKDADSKVSAEVLQGASLLEGMYSDIGEKLLMPESKLIIYWCVRADGEKECVFEFLGTTSNADRSKQLEQAKNHFLDKRKTYNVEERKTTNGVATVFTP